MLRIFQTEITNEIAQIDTQRANSYLASQQRSQVTTNLSHWQGQVTNLQSVIKTRGQTPLNFTADPQLQSLNKQLSTWLNSEQKYYNQWQCQLYGIAPNGLRCKPGNGPLSQNSKQSYLQAKQQVTTINGEISARKTALSGEQFHGSSHPAAGGPERVAACSAGIAVLPVSAGQSAQSV